jgi:hypothetical protein
MFCFLSKLIYFLGDCRDKPFSKFCDEMKYYKSGFTFIQTVVDSALIRVFLFFISVCESLKIWDLTQKFLKILEIRRNF